MQTLAILGRQPALGLAELESLFGADKITPLQGGAALLDIPAGEIPFARLGGVVKLGGILSTLDTVKWKDIDKFIVQASKDHSVYVPEGKLTIGLSLYGLDASRGDLERTALSIKKAVKSTGRPVRIVPNKAPQISTPQIIHNKLTHANGWELVFYRYGDQTILMRTNFVQDIESYTARDQARPMRDARVGMLPPKLAQIIINLTCDILPKNSVSLDEAQGASENSKVDIQTSTSTASRNGNAAIRQVSAILDPFCGTGVILQEAVLMGYGAYGTDLEARMIEYSKTNLEWLVKGMGLQNRSIELSVGDATSYQWAEHFDSVACEGYLGLPFAHMPSPDQLQESIQLSNTVMKAFLNNLGSQVKPGFRACIGMPAWHLPNSIKHLPCLGELEKLGWKRAQFKHAHPADLIYRRDDQVVGRELVVITKI
jgi:2-polyprenyl-3-methyl-5-hydroxy-6-metoxy-1,4-benzoquinol methylase